MRCRNAERLLSRRLDGPLSGSEERALAQHLEACAACRGAVGALGSVRERVLLLSELAPSRDLALAAGAAASVPVAAHRARQRWPALALAGASALALIVAVAVPRQGPRPAGPGGRPGVPVAAAPGADSGSAQAAPAVAPNAPRWAPHAPSGGAPRYSQRVAGAGPRGTAVAPARPLPPADDVAYVNGGRDDAMRRWAALRPDELAALQARVDRTLRQGDDFVSVPFPRIASLDDRGTAAAVARYRQEKEVVDPRLARRVTLGVKGMAFADLCKRLSDDTGIAITAGRTVADDKATVFCKERPLRDLMRQITHVFGYQWVRTGKEGDYHYELIQDLKGQLQEEELRARDRREALLALDREMERYRKYMDLTPEQAKEKAETAPEGDKQVLETLAGPAWAAAHLYFGLSADEMGQLRSGQQLDYSQNPAGGQLPLSPEMAAQVLGQMGNFRVKTGGGSAAVGSASSLPDGVPPSEAEGAKGTAFLRMSDSDPSRLALVGGGGFTVSSPGSDKTSSILSGRPLAVGTNPSVASPENARANARLAADPALKAAAALAPHSSGAPVPAPGSGQPVTGVTSADVLEAFHKATGLDVVGDYFTRLYLADFSSGSGRVFDKLNHVCDAMHMRWFKEDGWLQFRSASFFNDRLQEVPNRLLDRWAASRKEHQASTVDDLTEMGGLSDVQLNSRDNRQALPALYGLAEWEIGSNPLVRKHLRFLAGLGSMRQAAACGQAGVVLGTLTLTQQQQLVDLLQVPPAEAAGLTVEDLTRTKLQVRYDPKVPASDAAGNIQGPDRRLLFVYECSSAQAGRWRLEVGPNTTNREKLDGSGGERRIERQRRSGGP